MISQDSIDGLKSRIDIVDVIGNYVELKKAGANYKGLCPFHDEKSPSFSVSPSKQFYHCFGCQASGDAIKFVMEYEKLTYPEAIEKLAGQYNYSLAYTQGEPRQQRSQLMEKLNDWYRSLLDKTPTAMQYLHDRGIYESSIEHFGIGYAPASHLTLGFIKQNQFSMAEAVELGVAGESEGREYARFIERITFPIHAPNGAIVGFGGRTITGHQAKYVNSPQTKLFNKSRLLYAYNHARESIHKRKEMIVTEGYLDVIMLHQAGFTQAVATLGTALTSEHLPLLRKGEPRVIMAYDGDAAGRNAALKASKLLSAAGFDGGVVLFEGGRDPADMVKEGRVEELGAMFRQPRPFIDFVLETTLGQYDLANPRAKEQALAETTAYLKTLSPLMQEEYKRHLAARMGISPGLVRVGSQPVRTAAPTVAVAAPSSHRDLWELSLIKTVLERPGVVDALLDFIAPQMLRFHAREFATALQGDSNQPELIHIVMDEAVPVFPDDETLKSELLIFLRKYYEHRRQAVMRDPSIPSDKKYFLNRQILGKIAKLKKGELVGVDA
ncbi:DNA primase [Sulfurimonas diazotrophicus]|uniref:DNA primase n=1 Tax=Sulfurimonas diazotrophicus TaxID=3131939 RepID=A0ABZ3H9K5_9BACT